MLEAIVRKCMEKDLADRYQSADELASALKEVAKPPSARGAAPIPGQSQQALEVEEAVPTGRDWRRMGQYTVLGEIGPDDSQGFRRHVQAGADEFVIVRKNGQIADVYSEDRKETRSFGEFLKSLLGLGPNTEVYKATRTRFNIVFWLGDDDTLATGNKSFTFGLPVITSDGQVIPGKINLWIEIDEELAENTLLLLKGQNALNRFDIASEIRDELLAKVLGLELNQYTFDELRGNRSLLAALGTAIQREVSGTLGAFGLRIQDYSISWGLTLDERADIDQQRHQVAVAQVKNLNEIDKLRSIGKEREDEPRSPIDVVLRPSKLKVAVIGVGVILGVLFLLRMATGDSMSLPWSGQEAPPSEDGSRTVLALPMEIDENSFVNFPDEALEAAVIDSLGKGLKGQITLEDLAALTEMNADSREISNLSGIEHAVNLTLLEISSNPISDFSPLASLTKLEHLNITGVGLSDLSFLITLKNLKQLTLHANEIADISLLSHLTSLEYLNLDRNTIVDITPLLSLNRLETLNLFDNALLNTESLNKHVPNLMSRGIEVTTGCSIYC